MSKLYCIAKSEKASKGQGGNEWLDIDIKNEQEKVIMRVRLSMLGENIIFHYWDITMNGEGFTGEIKGKK
jgi:hypothetical protein